MQIDKYLVNRNDTIEYALFKIENNHLGVVFVEDDNNKVIGCATDGDIRRFLLEKKKLTYLYSIV